MNSEQRGAEKAYLSVIRRECWSIGGCISEKRDKIEWRNKIGYEQIKKGGSDIKY